MFIVSLDAIECLVPALILVYINIPCLDSSYYMLIIIRVLQNISIMLKKNECCCGIKNY